MIYNLKSFIYSVIVMGLVVGCVIASIVIFNTTEKSIADAFSARIEGIGYTVSEFVNLDDMKKIQQLPADEVVTSKLFLDYFYPLNKSMLETKASYLYIFQYGGESDISYCVDAEDFNSDLWCPPNEAEVSGNEDLKYGLYNAFRNIGGVSDLVDSNEWGLMISGTFPIKSSNNDRSFYMTGVDFTLEDIVPDVFKVMTIVWVVFILVSAIAVTFALFLSKNITKSLDKVRSEILKIASGKRSTINFKNMNVKFHEIIEEIDRYSTQSKKQLIDIKSEQLEVKKEMLNRYLTNNINVFYDDFKFEFDAPDDIYCDAIIDSNEIIIYSFPKINLKNYQKMKTLAIKREISEHKKTEYILDVISNQFAIFDKNRKLRYSKGAEIKIDIIDADKLIKIEFLSKSNSIEKMDN